jgi:hypothetical protein
MIWAGTDNDPCCIIIKFFMYTIYERLGRDMIAFSVIVGVGMWSTLGLRRSDLTGVDPDRDHLFPVHNVA